MTSFISATQAKLQFGNVLERVKNGEKIIIEKNNIPEVVLIPLDEYEDFLEVKDLKFQTTIKKGLKKIKKGEKGTLDDLYRIHRQTEVYRQ